MAVLMPRLACLTFLVAVSLVPAVAHIPLSVNQSNIVDGFGGYGYLPSPGHSESEAQAASVTEFTCDPDSQRERISTHCGGIDIRPEIKTENLLRETMKLEALSRLQEQALEYLALRLASVSKKNPLEITRPECISANSPTWAKIQANLISPNPNAINYNFRGRLQALKESIDPKNVAHGMLWMKRLQVASVSLHCNDTTSSHYEEGSCSSIEYQMKRLANQYPVLWSAYGIESTRIEVVESNLDILVGMSTMSDKDEVFPNIATSPDSRKAVNRMLNKAWAEGRDIVHDAVTSDEHDDYLEVERRFDQAFSDGAGASTDTPMGQAYKRFVNGVQFAANGLEATTRAQMNNLCSYSNANNPRTHALPGLSNSQKISHNIRDFAANYPSVIRQALVDMPQTERALAQAVLCESGAMPKLRLPKNCSGVSGGPLPGSAAILVDQISGPDWPYGMPQRMKISQPTPTQPVEVSLKVNLVLGPELQDNCPDQNHDGVLDCLERLVNVWGSDANGFLNCSTGQVPSATLWQNMQTSRVVPCPDPVDPGLQRSPGVKFKISFQTHTSDDDVPEPKVTIHRCFNSSIPGGPSNQGSCKKVDQFNLSRCLTTWTIGVPRTVENCQREIAQRRLHNPEQLNRADSGNYSLTDSPQIIRHEILHALGLPEEYQDQKRPYGHIGEHDSIMRDGRGPYGRIYPRHLNQILAPVKCRMEDE